MDQKTSKTAFFEPFFGPKLKIYASTDLLGGLLFSQNI